MTTTIKLNDKRGSRDIMHINIIVFDGALVQFKGESIPPVARVVNESFDKNGKWSATTWVVELIEGAEAFAFAQDWGTGQWFTGKTWAEAVTRIRNAGCPDSVANEAIVRFIRSNFPKAASELDKADTAWQNAGNVWVAAVAAQTELSAAREEVGAYIAEQEASVSAKKVRAALLAAKGGKMSLADLKAAMV
jgi:hypothetical protein